MGVGFLYFNNYVLEGTYNKKCHEGNLGTLNCLYSLLLYFMQYVVYYYLQIQIQFCMSYVDGYF